MDTRKNRQIMAEWSCTPPPSYQPAKADDKAAAASSVYRSPSRQTRAFRFQLAGASCLQRRATQPVSVDR